MTKFCKNHSSMYVSQCNCLGCLRNLISDAVMEFEIPAPFGL